MSSGVHRPQQSRIRPNPHAPQVQPICIPARLDGDIGRKPTVAVPSAGRDKKRHSLFIEMEMPPVQLHGELGAAMAVKRVMPVVAAPGVVEERE